MDCQPFKCLLDSAGVPAHRTEDDVEEWPDPESFEENLTVHGVGDSPLKFKLPNICDVDITGVEEVTETLVSFPPYADLKGLLKPIHIPAAYQRKGATQPKPTGAIREDPVVSTGEAIRDTHEAKSSQEYSSLPHLPLKREREETCDSESQNQIHKKTLISIETGDEDLESCPMVQDVSMSGSIEILDSGSDDSVIDLTQDN